MSEDKEFKKIRRNAIGLILIMIAMIVFSFVQCTRALKEVEKKGLKSIFNEAWEGKE